MKLKLDENLGTRGASLFRAAGHDVATVYEQRLTSSPDDNLINVCTAEDRCLVTLDLDFSNPFFYPPGDYAGIAVLRMPRSCSADDLWSLCRLLVAGLGKEGIRGKL